jgi:hypothetical protein
MAPGTPSLSSARTRFTGQFPQFSKTSPRRVLVLRTMSVIMTTSFLPLKALRTTEATEITINFFPVVFSGYQCPQWFLVARFPLRITRFPVISALG